MGFSSSFSQRKIQQITTKRTIIDSTKLYSNDNDEEEMKTLKVNSIDVLNGVVTLPGSKSLSNRCLLLAALSKNGPTKVKNLLDSDDTKYMLQALDQLSIRVDTEKDSDTVVVHGGSGPILSEDKDIELFLGNAGTAMRPLAAALCFSNSDGGKKIVLDGVPRMRERPIADLIDGLQQLGAGVECVKETGCPPVTIHPKKIQGGKNISISGKMSSQFVSSLLMAAPLVDGGEEDIVIEIKDELISAPYVALTINLMKQFGVDVQITSSDNKNDDVDANLGIAESLELALPTPRFTIRGDAQYVSPKEITVEGDASSASYFLAGAAMTKGNVEVKGCGLDSVQGDIEFADVLEQMGANVIRTKDSLAVNGLKEGFTKLKGVDVDCGRIPDAAMTLAAVALFADGPTTIRNVYSWRLKETERMKAIVAECTKLGATVEEFRDYCIITPPEKVKEDVEIDTYDDHRMAMTFGLVACGEQEGLNVIIRDPDCTAKTFPTYFTTLESVAQRSSN